MKLPIPKENQDIRKAVNGRLIRQIVFCLVWCIVVALFMIFYGYGYFEKSLGNVGAVGIGVLLCLIPFLKCKCWQWFDSAYEGTVISCKQTSTQKMNRIGGGMVAEKSLTQIYTQNIQLRLLNGKEKTVKITRSADEDIPYYYEGDFVRHYRGTNFIQVISDSPEVPRICVMCGTNNRPDATVCGICKKTLIDHRK